MTLTFTALWDALGWAILHSLWQGALIGFIVWGVRALATEKRAWLRYLAGMGGLVATFAAFLATFMVLTFDRAQSWTPVETAGGAGSGELTLSISVLPLAATQGASADALVPWLGMVWAIGFAFLSLQAYRAYATTRWLATQGLRSPGADWTARFTALITRSRTHEKIRLFVSEHVSGPMTLGALRPIVLVPVGFLTALPPAQVEAILLHELAHIRRHDFLFGLIQTAIRTVLYFNPAVIMLSRQVDEDREQACDDIAVSVTGNAADLARGLAALRLNSAAPALAMSADGGPLLTRLNRLMGRPVPRSASSRLSAAAVSALLLGTAAWSTVSMAHPHTPEAPPEAPEAPSAPETAALPDTIVRGGKIVTGDKIIRTGPNGKGPAIVLHPDHIARTPELSPRLAMPAMPAMPATPMIAPVPMPVPVFSDFDSADAFEDAMEAWAEKMEVWGEQVEEQFEGEWEDRMEAWGEEMEVWGEQIEEMSEDFAETFDGREFEGLAELQGLAKLVELEDLADLTALKDDVWILDGVAVDAKAEEVRGRVLRQIESRIQDIDWQETLAENQAERAQKLAEARAERERERAYEQAERLQKEAERARNDAYRNAERAKERAKRDAKRNEQQARRVAEARAEASRHKSQSASHSEHYSSSHSKHTVTISGAEKGESVVINGRELDVDRFRRDIMSALAKDGLIKAGDQNVTLFMCSGTLEVDGRKASKAQAKRYAKMFEAAGLDLTDSLKIKLKPDVVRLTMSGHGKKDVQKISVGTVHHSDHK